MTEEKPGTLEGLANLSSEEFIQSALLEQEPSENGSKREEKEEEEQNAPEANQQNDTTTQKVGDEASKKKAQEPTALGEKAKKAVDNKAKWAEIETELYKGKTEEEIKVLKEQAKKEDSEKYKGKTEDEILALKIEEHEDSAPVNLEFQLPEEQKAAAKEGKFTALAKEVGFDVAEDTIESFKESLEKHYEKKFEINLGKHAPEAQRLFNFLENGGSIEAFIEPHKQINEYLALSDVDLITKDLEARKWSEDKIEKEITALTENDQLDVAAHKIREGLGVAKDKITQNIIAQQEKTSKLNADYKTKSVADQVDSIKKALNTVSEYMDTPITDKHREFVAKKFVDGKYADILKDPKALADFLLYQEFGKHGIANIKAKATHEAKMKYKKDRHAIPPIPGSGAGSKSSQNATGKIAEGNWEALPMLQE